ncbi:unnamed protein product, partial [Prorocentrum cordatum]
LDGGAKPIEVTTVLFVAVPTVILPIPVLRRREFAHGCGARQLSCERRCRGALRSFNALDAPSRALRAHHAPTGRRPTLAQRSILRRTWAKVLRFPSRPAATPSDAFYGLLKSTDMRSDQPQHLRPYDPSKLRVLRGLVTPRPLRDWLPPAGAHALDNADSVIYCAASEIDALTEQGLITPARPYWGPRLRHDRAARRDIVMRLRAVGLVGFRLGIRAQIGAFFVAKKDGMLRLVIDGREASSLHRRPPHSALGSAGAQAGPALSPSALRRAGLADTEVDPRGAGVDLRDGFYQFVDDDLADWFGFDFPEAAGYFGDPDVYFTDTRTFGQSAETEAVTRLAGSPYPRVISDKRAAPTFALGRPLASPYVDNATLFGVCAEDIGAALDEVCAELDRLNLAYHEKVETTRLYESVGVVFDGQARKLRHTDKR